MIGFWKDVLGFIGLRTAIFSFIGVFITALARISTRISFTPIGSRIFGLIVLCAPIFGLGRLDDEMGCGAASSGASSSSNALPPNPEVDINNRNRQNLQFLQQTGQPLSASTAPPLNRKRLEYAVHAFHQTPVPATRPPDEDEDWVDYLEEQELEDMSSDEKCIEAHNRLHGRLVEFKRGNKRRPPSLEEGFFEPEGENLASPQANCCAVVPEGYVRQAIDFCRDYTFTVNGVEYKSTILEECAFVGSVAFSIDTFNSIVVSLPISDGVLRARSMDGCDWFFRKSGSSNCFSLSMDRSEGDEINRCNEEQGYPSLVGQGITISRSSYQGFFVDEHNHAMVVFIPAIEQKIIPSLVFDNLVRKADSGDYFVGDSGISKEDMLKLGEDIITKQRPGIIEANKGPSKATLLYQCINTIHTDEQSFYIVALNEVVSAAAASSSSGEWR